MLGTTNPEFLWDNRKGTCIRFSDHFKGDTVYWNDFYKNKIEPEASGYIQN